MVEPKIKPRKCKIVFPGDITEKRQSTILSSFEKTLPRDQSTKER